MSLEKNYLLKDRYRIIEILGQGGMGSVYHAEDENLGVDVAVKENLFTSEEYSRQFRREATILATMRHPNLPRVIDHFEVEEQGQYMVMDFIEGEDLRQRMDRIGSLGDEDVIIIGASICDALDYLHTRTPVILHRDIKPGNIKINPEGQVYLVDFGLAKIVEGSQVTTTGARAMTPGYSSPEQYGTARTDARSDVYSLGATLYAALTNTIPEDGLARAMEQADLTPIRKRNPKVSRRMATAVEKALNVHPEDRYQTALEFKTALLQASTATRQIQHPEELTIQPPPPEVIAEVTAGKRIDVKGAKEPEISGSSSTRKRKILWRRVRRVASWTAFVLVAALIIWGGFGMPGREALASFVPVSWVNNITGSQEEATPTLTAVVVVPTATEDPQAMPTITLTPTATEIPPTATVTPTPTKINVPAVPSPTATPDDWGIPLPGEEIAFASLRNGTMQIYLYSFADESITQLTDLDYGACQPAWSPDGQLLAFITPCLHNQRIYTDSFIFVMDMETGDIYQLAVDEGSFNPTWSPDGSSILYTMAEDSLTTDIYRIDTGTSKITQMTDSVRINFYPEWSPDGTRFSFASNRSGHYFLYVMENDPESIPKLVARTENRMVLKSAWSENDEIVFVQGSLDSFQSLWVVRESMIGASDLIYEDHRLNQSSLIVPELDPDFNSNYHWLAYESWPDGGDRDIYIMREDGSLVLQITSGGRDDFDPAWRPYTP